MASKAMNGERQLHVVMFPWLAFGHIIPFFELSKFIARKGHKITFISTPRNIDRLPKLPSDLVSSLALVKIPLPKLEGLPENAQATMDVLPDVVKHLKKAYDGMKVELTQFLENSDTDIIIYDFASHWLPAIATRLGISRFFFCIFNAWFFAFLGNTKTLINGLDDRTRLENLVAPPEWVTFETKVAYRLYEANRILGAARMNASGCSDLYRAGKAIEGCNAMIIRHCNEFEPKWLKLLQELHQIEVIPLGLMPPHVQDTSDGANEAWMSIKNWLCSQNKQSVVYVALGSEVVLSRDQIIELAHGLELSGLPFLWVLRKPAGSVEEDTVELPDGFEERIKGRGVVWKNWAPQLKILGHEAVGAFLTHCGWSSIVEGITFGRPLIMLPFVIDQGLNARILAEKQVGVEVPRNEQDGSYTRNAVAQTLRMVMVEDEGQKHRDTAKATSTLFGDKELHDRYLDNFVVYLENLEHKP
ncbi:putative UDP-rhamnose:rhamnosyltransferase 1 [Sesamum alatum]|uniref:Glycosyltransferase n=1 Tax=Sesamum alatum TaxID=300844 RepID=A0AAE2CCD7_9LAMI|nr:putative UDP-rhamnose:rhamnosyltransferase 1 [Sesamum alatum]